MTTIQSWIIWLQHKSDVRCLIFFNQIDFKSKLRFQAAAVIGQCLAATTYNYSTSSCFLLWQNYSCVSSPKRAGIIQQEAPRIYAENKDPATKKDGRTMIPPSEVLPFEDIGHLLVPRLRY